MTRIFCIGWSPESIIYLGFVGTYIKFCCGLDEKDTVILSSCCENDVLYDIPGCISVNICHFAPSLNPTSDMQGKSVSILTDCN